MLHVLLPCLFWMILASPLPEPEAEVLDPILEEGSGLTASQHRPGKFWALNDSGHAAVISLMDASGEGFGNVAIEGATNVDWETLTSDRKGSLWIGDVGNNKNARRDLTLYRVTEPPAGDLPEAVKVEQKIQIRYPDQTAFPPENNNFDCEGMFVWNDTIYLLTKHRADRDTKLYRLPLKDAQAEATLEFVERFSEIGHVTGAELHPDGRRLAILTFSGIWLFERPEEGDAFLSGPRKVLRFENWALKQIEAIAWMEDDHLIVTNEQRQIFYVPLTSFEVERGPVGP